MKMEKLKQETNNDKEPIKDSFSNNQNENIDDIDILIDNKKALLLKDLESVKEIKKYKIDLIKNEGGSEEELDDRLKNIKERINKLISGAIVSLEILAVSFVPSSNTEKTNIGDNKTSIYVNTDISPVTKNAKVFTDFVSESTKFKENNSESSEKDIDGKKLSDFNEEIQKIKDSIYYPEGVEIENKDNAQKVDSGPNVFGSNKLEEKDIKIFSKEVVDKMWESKKWNEEEPYMNWYYQLSKEEREAFKKNNYLKNNDWDNISGSFNFKTKLTIKATELLYGNKFGLIKQKLLDITENLFKFYEERERSGEMTKEEKDFKKELLKQIKNRSDDQTIEELKREIEDLSKIKLSELSPKQKDIYFNLIEKYLGIDSGDKYLKESSYYPTEGKKENSKFFDFSDDIQKEIQNLSKKDFESIFKKPRNLYDFINDNTEVKIFLLLKKKNITFGSAIDNTDRKGERYISYYYNYDLSPNGLKDKTIDFSKVNFPFMIYGRIYEKDLNISK